MMDNAKAKFSLKDIADKYGKPNKNARRLVQRLIKREDFGEVVEIFYIDKQCRKKPTYLLNEKQARIVERRFEISLRNSHDSDVVYLITDGEYTKIGVTTTNATARLKQCQTGNPKKLWIELEVMIENAFKKERELHDRFAEWRMEGEWFRLSKKQLEALKEELTKEK